MNQPELSASLLAADGMCLGAEAQAMLAAGCTRLHLDIMDMHYVNNLSFGPWLCKGLRELGITAPLDVHLMTNPVDELIRAFAAAGASEITFHPEATDNVLTSLRLIQELGCAAGLAVNPEQDLAVVGPYLVHCQHILLMSVTPGRGGQKWRPEVLSKVTHLRTLCQQAGHSCSIGMDGGVGHDNAAKITAAGVDRLVMGTALFAQADYAAAVQAVHYEIGGFN